MSPRGVRVEPGILVSIHGSAPVYSLHFQKPDNISDGVYKRVLGKGGKDTNSHKLDLHATGYWSIFHAAPLRETYLT